MPLHHKAPIFQDFISHQKDNYDRYANYKNSIKINRRKILIITKQE